MGIYDRDYARAGRRGMPGLPGASSLSVTTRLIIANVAIWFLYAGAYRTGRGGGAFFSFLSDTFLLHTDQVFSKLKLWQPFTAIWFHDPTGLGHVFFNMLFLFFFGRIVEGMIGGRALLKLYLFGGMAATLVMIPLAWIQGFPITGLGASGAVYAIGVFAALRVPNLTVILIFVPMPLWVMVGVFMVGREMANLVLIGSGVGTSVGHLAGAVAGWAFHRFRWHRAPGAGADWLAAMRKQVQAANQKRKAAPPESPQDREQVDRLLEKIHVEGIGALTREEKDFLQRASRDYGGR